MLASRLVCGSAYASAFASVYQLASPSEYVSGYLLECWLESLSVYELASRLVCESAYALEYLSVCQSASLLALALECSLGCWLAYGSAYGLEYESASQLA